MVSKLERAEFWPDDLTLLEAHRAQAGGIHRLVREGLWREPSTDRLRIVGNYMLLSSFMTPDVKDSTIQPDRIELEKLNYFDGMLSAGFKVIPAARNTEAVYSTNLRKMIYPLLHIPEGSPELIETRRNGRVVSTALDIKILCKQAHLLEKPTE